MGYAFLYAMRNAPPNKPHPLWLCQLEEQWQHTTHGPEPAFNDRLNAGKALSDHSHASPPREDAIRQSWPRKPHPRTKSDSPPPKPPQFASAIASGEAGGWKRKHDGWLSDLEWDLTIA